jgi:adenosine deaminase
MRLSLSLFSIGLIVSSLSTYANVFDKFAEIKSNPTALYNFLLKMPKGGELHYHLAGGFYPEKLLELTRNGHYCLNTHTFVMTRTTAACVGIDARELFKQSNPYYNKTIRAWSLKDVVPSDESPYEHFFTVFDKFMQPFTDYSPALLADIMRRAASQHEQYLEVMVMPDSKSITGNPLSVIPSHYKLLKQQLLTNNDFIKNNKTTLANGEALVPLAKRYLKCHQLPKQAACQLTVKLQYYVLRNQPLGSFFAQALHAFVIAKNSKAFVGVNLVQQEDGFYSLRDYKAHMQIFSFLHNAYPSVNIALHAGELSATMVNPNDLRFHINDAITIGHAQRIGHGVDIGYEHNAETLVKQMVNESIAVEINLISNRKILGINGKNHPLRYYLAHQVPVVLSTDDEGILRTDLTAQYVEAVRYHEVSYHVLKQITRNALSFSFLQGRSIWVNNLTNQRVIACQDLNSNECQAYIHHSEKAKLQWQLELKLLAFEKEFD